MDLAEIRRKNNHTQQSLADAVGVTRQMIGAIENGARPSIETAKKIAKELRLEWIVFYETEISQASGE